MTPLISSFDMDRGYSQHTRSECSIQDLSAELLFMIMDHLPSPTQFDLARTCKRLAFTAQGVLERHQDSHTKYHTASDLDPSTVPLLLRSAFGQGDPIPAWHVRSFEVWKDRTTWSDWQTFGFHAPLIADPDNEPSHLRVAREDVRRYLYWFEGEVGEDLEFDAVEGLLTHIDSGHDGLLKALLFARLERLEDLKFVTRLQEAGSCLTSLRTLIAECIKKKASDDEKEEEASRKPCDCAKCTAERDQNNKDTNMQDDNSDWDRMLDRIEKRSVHLTSPNTPWPVGFLNIRKMAVGVESGTWMDDDRDEEPCNFLFLHLLRLPSLNSIYFKRLCAWEDGWDWEYNEEEEECEYSVCPKGSSSVKHIFLHGSSGRFGEDQDSLWGAPQELLTVSFRFDGPEEFDGATGTANSLARVQKNSLQSLMWYGCQGNGNRNILGDHCVILDNEEIDHFKRLPALQQVSYSVYDIELCMQHADTYQCLRFDSKDGRQDDDEQGNIYDGDTWSDDFVVRRVATMFPRTIETLVLWDTPDEEDTPKLIERGLIRMIEGGQYPHLKAIYLQATERVAEGAGQAGMMYQEVFAAGVVAGVDVYASSDPGTMRHLIDFTEAPDESDLKSGFRSGVRPADWVFDPYVGRRIRPGSTSAEHNALWAKQDSRLEEYHGAVPHEG